MSKLLYGFSSVEYGQYESYQTINDPTGIGYSSYWLTLGSCGAYTHDGPSKHQTTHQVDGFATGVDLAVNQEISELKHGDQATTHIERVSLQLGEDVLNLALWVNNDPTTPLFTPSYG